MNWQGAFKVIIRIIFIFAYIAFLAASIRHVATFFHNFEADQNDWVNPFTLAVSIDLTALVLTVGVMFFRGNMPWYAQMFTWIFIVALTAFSWFVNWEYAMTFQGNDLKVTDTLRMLNPILASSFAFLNLAYSVVAEFFSSKKKTAAELAAEIAELEEMEQHQIRLAEYRDRTRKPSVIQRVKATALEAREAVKEVVKKEDEQQPAVNQNVNEQAQNVAHDPVKVVPDQATKLEAPMLPDPVSNGQVAVDMIVPSQCDMGDDILDDSEVDTGEREVVVSQATPSRRITVKLDDNTGKQERNTDKLNKATLPSTRKATNSTADKAKRIRTLVKKNQNIKSVELAEKVGVTRQYASQIKSQVLSEMNA